MFGFNNGFHALVCTGTTHSYLLTWKIAPALAGMLTVVQRRIRKHTLYFRPLFFTSSLLTAGDTCVCKPSEITSMTAYLLCSVLTSAGIPAGVVNMVFGRGATAGNALVVHPDVPMVSFTGGTVTGEVIMRNSAPWCKKLSLELGMSLRLYIWGCLYVMHALLRQVARIPTSFLTTLTLTSV